MKYQDVIDALADADMPEAVEVVKALKAEQRKRRRPKRSYTRQSPMTPEKAVEARRLYHLYGYTQAQIAAQLDVNQGRISEALNSRKWG